MATKEKREYHGSEEGLSTPPIDNGTPHQKPKRKPDGEIQLMARIDRMLAGVDAQVAQRVVAWLASRMFNVRLALDSDKCHMPPV